ncbi:hypothetical protein LUZ61_001652 [Rhynchospora tenuis]|uniref:Uncharacterized protein n=1 Tax=Rhynchospora tenuis TaxID=198213 RepID=A0AAD6EQZ8_9POAL|nr:hypothetical protein LUZ61_001652 [Rhynchospora tenuis]
MASKPIGFLSLLFSFLILAIVVSPGLAEDVTVTVRAVTPIQQTDGNLVCATMDWWPKDKCNYGWCPWYNSSIINLDLNNTILYNAINAFKNLRIRLGGSLQDQIIYGVGEHRKHCENFKSDPNGMFTFTSGCLTMRRWDELNTFFRETGAIITFGLNALKGREKALDSTEYVGPWDSTNAHHFIRHTIAKGYKIDSWEFGNELCGGGVAAKVNATQYAQDLIKLKKIINRLYRRSSDQDKPKLLAPGGFFDMQWFIEMLQASGPNVVDVVTHHIYNLGPGNDNNLINRILDPFYLISSVANTYKNVEYVVKNYGPWSTPWIGESGGAFNSGGKDVSNAFVDSFWYLDQLGMVSVYGHSVFCRQALIGGNYALLDPITFVPNPDYYSALIWNKLMGRRVLQTTNDGSPYFRSYTHCSKNGQGVTSLFINYSNSTSSDVSFVGDYNIYSPSSYKEMGPREEYHLTPEGGNLKSRVMLLNGQPLKLTSDNQIPELNPLVVEGDKTLRIAPYSIAFIRYKNFNAPACA